MTSGVRRVHFPKTRLSKLIARSGGISYVAAMENARKNVETMRDQADEAIRKSVAEIDAIAGSPRGTQDLTDVEMAAVLIRADQIVTLAGTFGHELLDKVARSLCDLIDGLMSAGKRDLAPVAVHIQAMDMMTPGKATLTNEELETVVAELAKVRKHFNIKAIDYDEPEEFMREAFH